MGGEAPKSGNGSGRGERGGEGGASAGRARTSTWVPGGDDDARLRSPAVARNTDPIREVLGAVLPERGRVLEVACGTGEHALAFAQAFPGLDWQPSDPDPRAHASAAAWALHGPANLRAPLLAGVTAAADHAAAAAPLDAIVAINLIHIAPWAVTEALAAAAGQALVPEGILFLYGPFRRGGRHTSESNAAFDESLRAQDPDWGVRDLEAVDTLCATAGLARDRTVEMPANNLSAIYRKKP